MKPKQRNRAFTLIELLVVVAIIALLISIMLPSLKAAREEARKAKCVANLKSLGIASAGYLGENKDRFCWGIVYPGVPPAPVMRTWYFGGNRGDGADDVSWFNPDGPRNWYPNERPLNKYVTARRLGRTHGDLKVYECPSDKGTATSQIPSDPPSYETTYKVLGTSYQANSVWRYYATDTRMPGWGESQGDARVLELMDSIIRIFGKKGPSRAVLLYEDRADVALAGAIDIPTNTKLFGWHGKPDRHSILFLDGHAKNLYIEYKKVLDHNFGRSGNISYFCDATRVNCMNGTGEWVARQDYMEH